MSERRCPVCGEAMTVMKHYTMCDNRNCPTSAPLVIDIDAQTYADRLSSRVSELEADYKECEEENDHFTAEIGKLSHELAAAKEERNGKRLIDEAKIEELWKSIKQTAWDFGNTKILNIDDVFARLNYIGLERKPK